MYSFAGHNLFKFFVSKNATFNLNPDDHLLQNSDAKKSDFLQKIHRLFDEKSKEDRATSFFINEIVISCRYNSFDLILDLFELKCKILYYLTFTICVSFCIMFIFNVKILFQRPKNRVSIW